MIVPDGIDDPTRPSGGNVYDRRVCRGLLAAGWTVRERSVAGSWPRPEPAGRAALADVVARLPDDAVVLVDGLIASAVPEILVPQADRLRLVVLLHLPLGAGPEEAAGRSGESAVLSATVAVITTSEWSRGWLLEHYPLAARRLHVAVPGVDPAALARGTTAGRELLCVAAVTPNKGHDVLLGALAEVADLSWRCLCVGALTRDPGLVARLARQSRRWGIADRVRFVGARTGRALDASYGGADALVLATRVESYGMVVTEALARGLPVVATSVGGVPEALGRLADGRRPGLLVPPGDAAALAAALRRWLGDDDLRHGLRAAARARRTTLTDWDLTTCRISQVLTEAAA